MFRWLARWMRTECWITAAVREGFEAFGREVTGAGGSARPAGEKPAETGPAQREIEATPSFS